MLCLRAARRNKDIVKVYGNTIPKGSDYAIYILLEGRRRTAKTKRAYKLLKGAKAYTKYSLIFVSFNDIKLIERSDYIKLCKLLRLRQAM